MGDKPWCRWLIRFTSKCNGVCRIRLYSHHRQRPLLHLHFLASRCHHHATVTSRSRSYYPPPCRNPLNQPPSHVPINGVLSLVGRARNNPLVSFYPSPSGYPLCPRPANGNHLRPSRGNSSLRVSFRSGQNFPSFALFLRFFSLSGCLSLFSPSLYRVSFSRFTWNRFRSVPLFLCHVARLRPRFLPLFSFLSVRTSLGKGWSHKRGWAFLMRSIDCQQPLPHPLRRYFSRTGPPLLSFHLPLPTVSRVMALRLGF